MAEDTTRQKMNYGRRRALNYFVPSCGQVEGAQYLQETCANTTGDMRRYTRLKHLCTPEQLTGRAKNVVRKATQKLASEAGVSTAWARIFFTFGPHEPLGRLVSDIASALVAGQVVETTAGQQERDYLYVADVASALVALTESNLTGTINIASGESVPVRRIVNILGVLSGRTDLLAIGARASSSADPQRLVADVTRLRRELGFTPRYSLEEGLEATLEWWRTELPPESNTR